MVPLFIAYVLALAGVLTVDTMGLPRRRTPWPLVTLALVLTVATALFATLFAATGRPFLSSLITIGFAAEILIVSNAKYRVLREPLVIDDYLLMEQDRRQPRLSFGHFSLHWLAAGVSAAVALLIAVWILEPAVIPRDTAAGWQASGLIFGAVALLALVVATVLRPVLHRMARRRLPLPDPAGAVAQYGPLASLLLALLRVTDPDERPAPVALAQPLACLPLPDPAPHLIMVESESFFDVRRAPFGEGFDGLAAWTEVGAQARVRGQLRVKSFGANTLRTEFAALTGIPEELLGFDAANPYSRMVGPDTPSLAHALRKHGYSTVCIHPFDMKFFRRDRVMPLLGFESLVTAGAFSDADRCGHFIGDLAVAKHILSRLSQADGPQFLFAITIENHGPWDEDASPQQGYLRHLRNADAMVRELVTGLESLSRPSVLVVYGDHRPPLDAALGSDGDISTDYLVWSSSGPHDGRESDLSPDELPSIVLEALASETREPRSRTDHSDTPLADSR